MLFVFRKYDFNFKNIKLGQAKNNPRDNMYVFWKADYG